MKLTRRDFYKLSLGMTLSGVFPSFTYSATRYPGIKFGASTFCFRDMSLKESVMAMKELGITGCELFYIHAFLNLDERPSKHWLRILIEDQDKLREWRLNAQREHFEKIVDLFDRSGIEIYLYYSGIGDRASDEEVDREFQFASWLGVDTISTQLEPHSLKRFSAVAERRNIKLALHNTTSMFRRARELPSTAAQVEAQLQVSPMIYLNLDLGHFFAAGNDPLTFIRQHHKRIINIQLKDRTENEGPNVPCGEGDTPINEVIRLVRDKGWPISICVEYEHDADDIMQQMKQCSAQVRRALV